jgi:hypothetical protein
MTKRLILLMVLMAFAANAQFTLQGVRNFDMTHQSTQGKSVAISTNGNTVVVGGPQGSAGLWAWTRSASVWSQQAGPLSPGTASSGYSVTISGDGNTAAVGAPNDTPGQTGSVQVYTRSGSVWSVQGSKLVANDKVGTIGSQGWSLAMSNDGNTMAVGAYQDGTSPALFGAVYIWVRSAGNWTEQAKLVGSDHAGGFGGLGQSVAISADGNTVLAGAYADSSWAGAAWVWTRTGTAWNQQGYALRGTGAIATPAYQGSSVALSPDGDTAAIGGYNNNSGQGAVWMWTRAAGVWTQRQLVIGSSGTTASQGWSVALSNLGSTLIVGGPGDTVNGTVGWGSIWVFIRSGNTWTQQGSKISTTNWGGGAEASGTSVAITSDGLTAVSGAPNSNNGVGAFYVFTAPPPVVPNTRRVILVN